MRQIFSFAVVGTVGFIVDALVLLFLVEVFFLSIEVSRFFSFLVAVFITWLLNRNFTFKKSKGFSKKKEYILYLLIQAMGACINYFIFIVLVYNFELFKEYLILPLAIASLTAMFFNFFVLKKKIFV